MHQAADTAVFHICTRAAADAARTIGEYRAESLASEGFIHLSRAHQVPGTARMFYAGVPDLVLLVIDPTQLSAPLVYEPPAPPPGIEESAVRSAELFPHSYGPIPLAAIVDVIELAQFDGTPVHADTIALLRLHRFDRIPLEGTLYRSTWRSEAETPDGTPVGTAMIGMYAESPRSVSCFHRLTRDETWHAYAGDPFTLYLLHPGGGIETVTMGTEPLAGHVSQHRIPAGVWQAGEIVPGGRYALFGCTMAPGFTGGCFEAGVASVLVATYPAAAEVITRLSITGDVTRMPGDFAT